MNAQGDNTGESNAGGDPLALLTWDERCIVLRALGHYFDSELVYTYDRPIIENMEERCRSINDAIRASEIEAEHQANAGDVSEELARLRRLEASVRAEHEARAGWLRSLPDGSCGNPPPKELTDAEAETARLLAESSGEWATKYGAPLGYVTPECVFSLPQKVAAALGVTRKKGVGVVVLKREGHAYFEIVTNEQFMDLLGGRDEVKP